VNGLYILQADAFERIYPPRIQEEIAGLVKIAAPLQTSESIRENPSLLGDVDVIFSGWGAPVLDEAFMRAAPNLKAFFYGSGSVRSVVQEAFWARNIPITSSVRANAIPVAEFTLSQIIFGLKAGWQFNARCKVPGSARIRGWDAHGVVPCAGGYHSTVGLVSLGTIARLVRRFLRSLDVRVVAYDPYASGEDAARLNLELCSLEDVFGHSDVVSLHTPDLPGTRGMITGDFLSLMKRNTTFINTARSAVVRHDEMIDVLTGRPDLWAVLDVTEVTTDAEYRRLQELPNVTLTPHIAGSLGPECARMGRFMVDELKRFLAGQSLRYELTRERAEIMA
jgi:phosphoglycerate dehydrogenase-like enzyme